MVITLSNLIVQAQINSLGIVSIAAFTAYFKVENFVYLPIMAFGQANTTFCGQNYGAGKWERMRKGTGVSILMGILVTVTISTLLLTHGYGVFSLFSQNAEVIELGIRIAPGNLSLLFYICISGGFFRSAAGNGKNNGADGGYPCKYVRNPYAESLVPDAALSQRGRSGRNLSDHLDDYGCLPGRDVLAAE